MISRTHGLVLSLLLGAASAAGAYALIGTAKLTDAQTKPELVSSRQIAKRAHKLDEWGASLKKALASKPPALTPLNRYAAVSAGPLLGVASMPTVANPSTSAAQQTRAPTRKKIRQGPGKETRGVGRRTDSRRRHPPAPSTDRRRCRRRRTGAQCRRTRGATRGATRHGTRHGRRPTGHDQRERHPEHAGATGDTIAFAVG